MFKNFEKDIIKNIQLDQIYKKAIQKITEEEISLDNFYDLYSKKVIQKDKEYIEELEKKFALERSQNPEKEQIDKIATIFEALLFYEAESSEWLGNNVQTIKTSKYDDYKNRIDIVAEFQESNNFVSYLGLAIDVTTSCDLWKKFRRIKKEIERGRLAKVKYFRSDYLNFRGELSQLPRVIIGAECQTVLNLADLWVEKRKKELGEHFIQFQILEEILLQAETFEKYAQKIKYPEITKSYHHVKLLIEGILKEKNSLLRATKKRDKVFEAIKEYLKDFEL